MLDTSHCDEHAKCEKMFIQGSLRVQSLRESYDNQQTEVNSLHLASVSYQVTFLFCSIASWLH